MRVKDDMRFSESCQFIRAGADLLNQLLAVRQVVAIPPDQSRIARVLKKELQRRRFNMSIAEDHIGFLVVPCKGLPSASKVILHAIVSVQE